MNKECIKQKLKELQESIKEIEDELLLEEEKERSKTTLFSIGGLWANGFTAYTDEHKYKFYLFSSSRDEFFIFSLEQENNLYNLLRWGNRPIKNKEHITEQELLDFLGKKFSSITLGH